LSGLSITRVDGIGVDTSAVEQRASPKPRANASNVAKLPELLRKDAAHQ